MRTLGSRRDATRGPAIITDATGSIRRDDRECNVGLDRTWRLRLLLLLGLELNPLADHTIDRSYHDAVDRSGTACANC